MGLMTRWTFIWSVVMHKTNATEVLQVDLFAAYQGD